ncbi:diacylglycerol kinase [Caulobacter sp. HMWF009]|nr:diacylglycerol kinase [Caulobacter sp. HMWF009]PTT06743.1 diacylglycerol kinase [Caulobacter sp. HMWF025]
MSVRRVEIIANIASGSVQTDARQVAERLLAEHGITGTVHTPEGGTLIEVLRRAIDTAPDAVFIIAGDGTARAAAEMSGPDGPPIAPLPGGTMNMLPHALYGDRTWPVAMAECLERGVPKMVSGGEISGHLFFVAAILGSPALWADAREAARAGQFRLMTLRAQRALKRAFSGRLRFSLDGRPRQKTEALTLTCPLVSDELDNDARALEAAALDPASAVDVLRLGLSALAGTWREDPSVSMGRCRTGRVWARGHIPALLDGEPVRLGPSVQIRFRPKAFRALALPE